MKLNVVHISLYIDIQVHAVQAPGASAEILPVLCKFHGNVSISVHWK